MAMKSGSSQEKKTFGSIQHQSINLPKGGGAIRGVGEKFQANPVTGSGSFSIPLPVSPGRGGFQPELSLGYDSGSGNGSFGLGWGMGLPSITRKTDKLLPRYLDLHENAESDIYLLAGAEDLVPVRDVSGAIVSRTADEVDNGVTEHYTVYSYRPRIEGLFARIEKWVAADSSLCFHWRVTTKENITTIYGKSLSCRISDPHDGKKIFQWLIESSFDAKGNLIRYEYKQEDGVNIDSTLSEKERKTDGRAFVNRYIKRIKYSSFSGDSNRFHFMVMFDYGEHTGNSVSENAAWGGRLDPFSTFKAGFEVRSYRLCRRVMMFHNFTQGGTDTWELVKSLDLAYNEKKTMSFLVSATLKGYKKNGSAYDVKDMPPVEFTYSEAVPGNEIKKLDGESLNNLPAGLDDAYQWVDLAGEGSPGILSRQGQILFYKENLGGAKFGAIKPVFMPTALAPDAALQISDLDGDGVNELVVRSESAGGYYSYGENGWENFREFKKDPQIDWKDPNLKMLDLTGDGFPDIVISEANAFRFYPSAGAAGYDASQKVPVANEEANGPRIIFADATQSIYLADMTGDGLTDIVRIRNGEVAYWPNLGYGRFGKRIVMDNAPRFTVNGKDFNQHYIKLGDIDGSGTTDIVYLGNGKVEIFYNCAGNSWAEQVPPLQGMPADSLSSVSMIDLEGKGTMCLVWSTKRPGMDAMQMSYLDLMGVKPHLLTGINDNMGARTVLGYAPSTKFYLEDKRNGNPWVTRLSFPVHCLERVESHDDISGSRLVTEYRYHHGFFDGLEREFRGFGMVETIDTESFGSGDEHYVAPILTKTWYHTGAYVKAGKISKHYEDEYFSGDADAFLLADTVIEDIAALSADELREAYRALKGSALRQETYELGKPVPYEVKEANFSVRRVQSKGKNRHAIFFTHAGETLGYHYEQNSSDPRVTHEAILEVDNYGNVKKQFQGVYARRSATLAEQQKGYATLTVKEYINETNAFYRIGVATEEKVFELYKAPADPFQLNSFAGIQAYVNSALSNIVPVESEYAGTTPAARVVSIGRQYFWNESQSAALPFGETSARGLVHHVESAVFTTGLLTQAYGSSVSAAEVTAAGYVSHDGYYWNGSLVQKYTVGDFYLPNRTEDPFGGFVQITYDTYKMFPVTTTDALGNSSTALMDYRTLSPKRLTDANGNVSEAIFDEMGMVRATSVYGSEEGAQKGDLPLYDAGGNQTASPPAVVSADDIIQNPLNYLQNGTTYFYYDLDSWRRESDPPHFIEIARETHVRDLGQGETTRVRKTIGYSDGFERELQTKVQAEPGVAWVPFDSAQGTGVTFSEEYTEERWLVSGRTVYNNKQKPVKQYEPFYSGTHKYEDEEFFASYGVTSILHYDPLLRVVRTDTPKGFFTKVEFTPWEIRTYDENDTVKDSSYYAKYATLSVEEKEALDKAAVHYNTPHVSLLDTLGREFQRIEYTLDITLITEANRVTYEHITTTEFTITGKPKRIADPRLYDLTPQPPLPGGEGECNYSYTYDMHDQIIRTKHIDGADDKVLKNVMGNTVKTIDAKGTIVLNTYDLLQRPVSKLAINSATGLNNYVERMMYGEETTDPEYYNRRGKLYRHYDQAGRNTFRYTIKGEVRNTRRRIRTEYKAEANWPEDINARNGLVNSTNYITDTGYDALGRVSDQTNPDNSIMRPEYHLSGNLNKVTVQLKGESTFKQFVTGITYNPKGQRENITYGNGTKTDYTYERETFRLTSLITTRTSDNKKLQDIKYTYDPVGNITLVNDASIPTVFNNNQMVEPKQKYIYDALYRLIEAEGREHTALNNPDYYKDAAAFKQSAFIHLTDVNDSNKLANYTRRYTYDKGGNLTKIQHIAANTQRSFTREINVDENSNRWLPKNMGTNPNYNNYYDANGNIINLEHIPNIKWNYRDNISAAVIIDRPSGTDDAEYYVYDAAGQRTRKVKETYINSTTTEYEDKIYVGGVEIKNIRRNSTSVLTRTTLHIMDDKKRIAISHNWTEDDNLRELNSTSELNENKTRYQYGNHLDSASLELSTTASIISYEEYFPYGDTSFIAGTNQKEVKLKEYRYTGKEKDDVTGLYYYGARYYASWLGRWMSADPLFRENPSVYEKPRARDEEERKKNEEEFGRKLYSEGLNLYGYVKGNPVKLVDPKGHGSWGDAMLAAYSEMEKSKKTETSQSDGSAKANAIDHLEKNKMGFFKGPQDWSGGTGYNNISSVQGDDGKYYSVKRMLDTVKGTITVAGEPTRITSEEYSKLKAKYGTSYWCNFAANTFAIEHGAPIMTRDPQTKKEVTVEKSEELLAKGKFNNDSGKYIKASPEEAEKWASQGGFAFAIGSGHFSTLTGGYEQGLKTDKPEDKWKNLKVFQAGVRFGPMTLRQGFGEGSPQPTFYIWKKK